MPTEPQPLDEQALAEIVEQQEVILGHRSFCVTLLTNGKWYAYENKFGDRMEHWKPPTRQTHIAMWAVLVMFVIALIYTTVEILRK